MSEIWRKDYEKYYKEHSDNNKSVYDVEWCNQFIGDRLDGLVKGSNKSLLDVGCGDGVWSNVLSNYFIVTGIDNSVEGINNCRNLTNKGNARAKFVCDDIFNVDKVYDVVFCRTPEFFGGYSPDSEIFKKYERKVFKLFKEKLIFIVYSKRPFSTYANEEKTSYYHDIDVLKTNFSKYGNVSGELRDNYIVLKVQR